MADGDKIDYSLNFTAQELDNTHKLYLLFYASRKALACKKTVIIILQPYQFKVLLMCLGTL